MKRPCYQPSWRTLMDVVIRTRDYNAASKKPKLSGEKRIARLSLEERREGPVLKRAEKGKKTHP